MSSRRLGRIEAFRRASAGGWLITSLLPAGNPQPRDRVAIADWHLRQAATHPICFACSAPFSNERKPGGFLTARSSRVPNGGVAVTAICARCWDTMTADAVESAAAAVLRRNLTGPHGKFLD